MLSPGSPSKWQVQDSLSSTSSLLYLESEPTEDESAGSSESEAAGHQQGRLTTTPASQISHSTLNTTGGSSPSPSEGDLKFARKCSELRGYVRPLLELLNGLKNGRYEKGLSTFQQSLAMDRLRRIVGVLQKPELGEKYMGTLQQLEVMLPGWFPQVRRPQDRARAPHPFSVTSSPPPRWNPEQLQIPVKKRRLSWSDSDSQGSPHCKRLLEEERAPSPGDSSSWLSSSETTCSELDEESVRDTTCLVWKSGKAPALVIPPPATGGSGTGTQDCSVSSTTATSHLPAHSGVAEDRGGGSDPRLHDKSRNLSAITMDER